MSTMVTPEEQRAAKRQALAAFEQGCSVQHLLNNSLVPLHRATLYRLRQRFQANPETALSDGRHGHPSKLRSEMYTWLQEYCQAAPGCSGRTVQSALYERFAVRVSIAHLNRVRASVGLSRRQGGVGKKSAQLLS